MESHDRPGACRDPQGYGFAMKRRGLLGGLAALLVPAVALAQGQPVPMPPPDAAGRPRRRGPADMTFDEMNPKQRRRVAQALAGYGNPPVAPDQAAARWSGMTPVQKRQTMRAYNTAVRAARGSGAAPGAGPGPGPGGAVPPMPTAPR